MTLDELYSQLAWGELSQHQMGTTGSILDKDKPKLNSFIYAALTELHTYFPLIEQEMTIQQYDGITEYKLTSDFAQSNADSTEDPKYIVDTVEKPFLDDIIRIETAYDEAGDPVAINDEYDDNSVFTLAYNVLQIPFPVATNITLLLYRANHVAIASDAVGTTEIALPPALWPALRSHIAQRAYVALGNSASAGLASYYGNEYRSQIALIERMNVLQSSDGDSNIKLYAKGFS